jgi:hypothetical protein
MNHHQNARQTRIADRCESLGIRSIHYQQKIDIEKDGRCLLERDTVLAGILFSFVVVGLPAVGASARRRVPLEVAEADRRHRIHSVHPWEQLPPRRRFPRPAPDPTSGRCASQNATPRSTSRSQSPAARRPAWSLGRDGWGYEPSTPEGGLAWNGSRRSLNSASAHQGATARDPSKQRSTGQEGRVRARSSSPCAIAALRWSTSWARRRPPVRQASEQHGRLRPSERFLASHLEGRFQKGGTPEVVTRLSEITVDRASVTPLCDLCCRYASSAGIRSRTARNPSSAPWAHSAPSNRSDLPSRSIG